MMLYPAIITAAGLGTRLLPATKEMPKEMLPIFTRSETGLAFKPLLQVIYESLFDFGVREFYFIIGRGKRAIEDHFTPDYDFLSYLTEKSRDNARKDLEKFYRKIENSVMVWLNQPKPLGFGDAVLRAEKVIGQRKFIVHAGDMYVINNNNPLLCMDKIMGKMNAAAVLLLKRVKEPRKYGVALCEEVGGLLKITDVIEKPKRPPTNLAIVPIYMFRHYIFKALRKTPVSENGELQLTDAIKRLIMDGYDVYAVELDENSYVVDIGTPEGYWHAINITFKYNKKVIK